MTTILNPLTKTFKLFKRWPLKEAVRLIIAKTLSKASIIVLKKLVEEDTNYANLEKVGFNLRKSANYLLITKKDWDVNGIAIRRLSSDYWVFKQIFLNDEFKSLIEAIGKSENINSIIDAGANVGMSSVKFQSIYPNVHVISIEPDSGNFKLLKKNLEINKTNAIPLQSAIWNSSTKLYFDRSFRDGWQCSVRVTDVPNAGEFIESLSINDIVAKYNLSRIDVLKIDVEGSEKDIFKSDNDSIKFLDITKFIAIELHEEFFVTDKITSLLQKHGFELTHSGEYLIGRNKAFFANN